MFVKRKMLKGRHLALQDKLKVSMPRWQRPVLNAQ